MGRPQSALNFRELLAFGLGRLAALADGGSGHRDSAGCGALDGQFIGGSGLDRFSQYSFGRFGAESLAGYAGTGLRFDTGYLARAGWAFNILEVVRFDLSAEFARVNDSLEDGRFRNFSGVGLSFNVVGPWKTIWQGSYGRAVTSDVPGLEGTQEFQFIVLKLF